MVFLGIGVTFEKRLICIMGGMENNYQAYLVRFQRLEDSGHWRATLENAHTQEVIQFASERELLLFLLRRLQRPLPTETIDLG